MAEIPVDKPDMPTNSTQNYPNRVIIYTHVVVSAYLGHISI